MDEGGKVTFGERIVISGRILLANTIYSGVYSGVSDSVQKTFLGCDFIKIFQGFVMQ